MERYSKRVMKEYRSEVLDDTIVLLDNETEVYEGPYVSYSPSEIKILKSVHKNKIKQIHDLKKYFNGKVVNEKI